jgi:hypothetical protein
MDRIVWVLPLIAACGGNAPPLRLPEPPPAKSNACCGVVYDAATKALVVGADVETESVRLWEYREHPPAPETVMTDARGRFCTSSLPFGEYDLTVSRTGYRESHLYAVPVSDRGVRVRILLLPNVFQAHDVEGRLELLKAM